MVHGAARLRVPGPLGPARKLRLQHQRRASAAPPRIDLSLAARDLVPAGSGAPGRGGVALARPAPRVGARSVARARRIALRGAAVVAIAVVLCRDGARYLCLRYLVTGTCGPSVPGV